MNWWYKSDKQEVNAESIFGLQEKIKDTLREGKSLAAIHLYSYEQSFYIKTTNRISLNYFLSQHGFEETEDVPEQQLTLLFGEV
jgi:hypothetical protein